MNVRFLAYAIMAGLAAPLPAQQPPTPETTPFPRADESVPKNGPHAHRFFEVHEAFLKWGKSGPIGLLFLGDSITEWWASTPASWELWNEYYAKYRPANFGSAGDSTENVLWRIDHGELDGIDPKLVVLMIGTNNTDRHSAEEITAAIQVIVKRIQTKLPRTKILLLGIFPRGPRRLNDGNVEDSGKIMEKIRAINQELAKMDNGGSIRYLDISPKFLDADGKILSAVMPDQLHPNTEGYRIWAAAMQPLLEEMMSKK